MFVLPPPSAKTVAEAQYRSSSGFGLPPPFLETGNILSVPNGLESQPLLAGEGTYTLKDEIQLSMPPPYPGSEPNPQTQNPLATTPQPATCGTKISLLSLSTRNATPFYSRFMPEMRIAAIQEHPNEGRPSAELSSETGGTSSSGSLKFRKASAPAFGDGNPALEKPSNKNNKKSKPRNSMSKSNSSYISRTITGENLNKRLQDHTPEGLFAFCNINRAFQWLDLSAPDKKDQLSKMLFAKGHCLSHDINMVTKSLNHIDLVLGFSTSDILWIEAISQRYSRINKNGIVNATPCTEVRWIPGSEDLFMAAHMDGSIIVYDKNREDVAFVPDEKTDEALETNQKEAGEQLIIEKSVQSRNQKHNPVSFWKLSNQRINAFAFAPDNRHLAAVSEDGTLKIIDFLKEELTDIFTSYYGGLTCVTWSPDGQYVLTGGQDDLISIWSFAEKRIVARCQGHESWVTQITFDPWRCDDRNYRFGSVGEDCRVLLWDFNVGMLHRPKASSVRAHRESISSRLTSALHRQETGTSATTRMRADSNLSESALVGSAEKEKETSSIRHPIEPRARVTILPPVLSRIIDVDPVSWVGFTEDAILTSCNKGHIRTWLRPEKEKTPE